MDNKSICLVKQFYIILTSVKTDYSYSRIKCTLLVCKSLHFSWSSISEFTNHVLRCRNLVLKCHSRIIMICFNSSDKIGCCNFARIIFLLKYWIRDRTSNTVNKIGSLHLHPMFKKKNIAQYYWMISSLKVITYHTCTIKSVNLNNELLYMQLYRFPGFN